MKIVRIKARSERLTPREHKVVGSLARRKSIKEVATDLGISSNAVAIHNRNAAQKLGAQNRLKLVLTGVRPGRRQSTLRIPVRNSGPMETTAASVSPDTQEPCRTPRLVMDLSLTTEEAAAMLGVKPATMRDWKCQRVGPPYVQLTSRCVRYQESDIRKFISDRRVVPLVRSVGRFSHAPVHAAKKSVSLL
jgi:DNA-binding CsgD family transcriptional regulator/predicted DNA-binding transcriptional regulator AlpA